MANKCYIKQNGSWGVHRPAFPVYEKQNGQWVRIDQQLVTKEVIIEGYSQWCGSFRSDSASGNADYFDPNLYQGKYPSGYKEYKIGLMCFTDLFAQARATGTITKVELRLKNNHAYYNSGLKTRICGAWSLPASRPGSINYNVSDSNSYTGDWHFPKNGATPQWVTLDSRVHSAIQNNQINGFKVLAPSGWSKNDYGYFEGSNGNRPYVKLTVQYQVWE